MAKLGQPPSSLGADHESVTGRILKHYLLDQDATKRASSVSGSTDIIEFEEDELPRMGKFQKGASAAQLSKMLDQFPMPLASSERAERDVSCT